MEQLQQIAEFLRDAAYSDDRVFDKNTTHIEWVMGILDPNNDKGKMIFACAIWTDRKGAREHGWRSCSFRYEVNGAGLYDLKRWNEFGEIYFPEGKFKIEQLKEEIIKLFDIKKLFTPKEKN